MESTNALKTVSAMTLADLEAMDYDELDFLSGDINSAYNIITLDIKALRDNRDHCDDELEREVYTKQIIKKLDHRLELTDDLILLSSIKQTKIMENA